jgi:hypothetical protein
MFRTILAIAVLSTFAIDAQADDKKAEAAAIKKQLSEAEVKVRELKERLAKMEGEEVAEFKDVELYVGGFIVGERGRMHTLNGSELGAHKIAKVINEDTIRLQVYPTNEFRWPDVIVRGFPTKGISDDDIIKGNRVWKVVGTQKIGNETLKVLREVVPADLKAEKPVEKPPVVKPKPPVPTVTIKASADKPVILAGSMFELGIFRDSKQKEAHAALVEKKRIVILTGNTQCELVKRGDVMTEVMHNEEKYYVDSASVRRATVVEGRTRGRWTCGRPQQHGQCGPLIRGKSGKLGQQPGQVRGRK